MRATAKRMLKRRLAALGLPAEESEQFQIRLICRWKAEFRRRLQSSPAAARQFLQVKEQELRDLGASEFIVNELRRGCVEHATVYSRLVGNYHAVELLKLREVRQR